MKKKISMLSSIHKLQTVGKVEHYLSSVGIIVLYGKTYSIPTVGNAKQIPFLPKKIELSNTRIK